MLFWILFIIVCLISLGPFNIGGIRYKRLSLLTGCLFIVLVTILRFDVGFDYPNYFKTIFPYLDMVEYNRLEPANKIIYEYICELQYPPLLFIIYGIITLSLLFYSFKNYSTNFCIATLTYLAFFYLGGLSTIRQELAVSLILYGYRFIRDKKPIMYLITCIIASLFHDTAFVGIFLYPFLRLKSFKLSILSTISIIIFSGMLIKILLTIPSLSSLYHYFENSDSFKGGSLIRILYLGISLLSFIISKRNNDIVLGNMSLLCLLGTSFMFTLGGHIGGRIGEYFTIYFCILIPNIVDNYCKKHVKVSIYSLSLLFVFNIYISTKNPVKSPFTPYRTILTSDLEKPHFK